MIVQKGQEIKEYHEFFLQYEQNSDILIIW